MYQKGALDADAIGHFPHQHRVADARTVPAEGDALEYLDTLFTALDDFHVDAQGISAAKIRDALFFCAISMSRMTLTFTAILSYS